MKANQKGFSVVEILIVVVIIGLLGAVGWLVYNRQNSSNQSAGKSQSRQSSSAQTDTQTSSSDYLVLADFKVRIPLDDKTSGLKLGTVRASEYSQTDKMVPILAPELDSSWECEADPSDNFKGSIGMISITTQTKRSGPYEALATKRVGDYTYGFETTGSNCTDNPTFQKLVDAFKVQFDKMQAY